MDHHLYIIYVFGGWVWNKVIIIYIIILLLRLQHGCMCWEQPRLSETPGSEHSPALPTLPGAGTSVTLGPCQNDLLPSYKLNGHNLPDKSCVADNAMQIRLA